jgi:hypothetical protein
MKKIVIHDQASYTVYVNDILDLPNPHLIVCKRISDGVCGIVCRAGTVENKWIIYANSGYQSYHYNSVRELICDKTGIFDFYFIDMKS